MQSTNRKRDCDDAVTDVMAMALEFTIEHLINSVHSERLLWDVNVDASGEERIRTVKDSGVFRILVRGPSSR